MSIVIECRLQAGVPSLIFNRDARKVMYPASLRI